MADRGAIRSRDVIAIGIIAIASMLTIWMALAEHGAIELAFGRAGSFCWLAVALWLVGAWRVGLSRRWRVVLVTLPVIACPALIMGLLAMACARGDCL